jgi:hypothetical protein
MFGKNLPNSVYRFFIKHCLTSTKPHANFLTIVYFTIVYPIFLKGQLSKVHTIEADDGVVSYKKELVRIGLDLEHF